MHSVLYGIVRSEEELEALLPAWTDLWQRDPDAMPFQRPEWLLPWWHQFGSSDLRVVTILHAGCLIGFIPFYVYMEPRTQERQLLLMGAGTTDYLNGIFAPECSVAEIRNALELLCAEDGWDVLYASQLVSESKVARALRECAERTGYAFSGESCSRMPAVAMAKLPQKIRRNAMYYRNRALRLGRLELTMADASNLDDSFAALERLHTSRWQARGEAGVLADTRVLAWHREALPLLERSGCLRLCSLCLEDEMLGVLYSLIDPPTRAARRQYFYLTAYAQEYADLRPGTLLLALAIEAAAREGVQTIDMLRGDEAYKQMWHPERVPTGGVALHPQTSLGPSMRLAKATA